MAGKFTFADLTYLENLSSGDSELMREMIQIFIDQLPEFSEGLATHLKNGEYTALGALAHKARSSVAAMGLNSLAADLKTLEISTRAGNDPELYRVLVERFIDQVTLTGSELEAYMKTIS